MPSAQAQAHTPEEDPVVAPLHLADVDDVLLESARAARTPTAPVRAWRDDLTEALGVLSYAETVLTGDAALLRHCLATGPLDHKEVLDRLARAVSSGEGPAAVVDLGGDEAVFARAAGLLVLHERMATVSLTRAESMRRLLEDIESQLREISARRLQLEARLDAIRAAVIREYREGIVPTPETWLR